MPRPQGIDVWSLVCELPEQFLFDVGCVFLSQKLAANKLICVKLSIAMLRCLDGRPRVAHKWPLGIAKQFLGCSKTRARKVW